MYEIDEQQIRLWWQTFNPQNKLVEIRLLGKITFSGYFKSIDTLLSQLRPLLAHENYNYYGALQAYFTLNELNDSLYSREQRDIFIKKPKSTSTDSDVIRRRMVMLDFDACRVASVSASDEEYEKAHIKAVEVYKYLIEQGFKEPIVSTSGNGYHCYLPCDMPNDEEHTELIKRFLKSLGSMFSDNSVELDEVVYNAARVDKVAGTWAKKGSDSEERRWRLARILKVPKDLSPNDESLFQKIADLLPKEEQKTAPNRQRPNYNGSQFDLRSWLAKYGIVYREEVSGTSTKFVLQHCPWESEHSHIKEWESALFLAQDGQITFSCFHSHCRNRTWFDFRKIYEPNAYDRPIYQPQYTPRQYAPQKPKYQIKDEIPELGEKWKSLSSIKRADLTNFEKVKTGFTELDRRISGLFMSEVTVLSGSNACVDCDTEYFNGTQWKKISDFTIGEKVLQYNADGSAELVVPQKYIKSPCEDLYLIQSVTGVDQCVSENHDLVYMTSKGNLAKKSVSDMLILHNKSNKGFTGKFYTTFKYEQGCGVDLTNDEIRLMCAVICDGHFSNAYKDKNIVRINIKKERKKERLEILLDRCGISYRKEQYNPHDKGFNTYLFHSPRREKEFGDYWYDCNAEQLAIVADEILHWDGSINNNKRYCSSYSSISKKNIDFVQFAFASIGIRTHIGIDDRVGKYHSNGKYQYKSVCYNLTICRTKNPSIINPIKKKSFGKIKTKDGYKYCFTVPSGMLVLRRNGNINITGNSGKSSWLNTLIHNIIEQNFKVALWSGEMRDDILKTWIHMPAAGRRNMLKSKYDDGRYYVPDSVAEKIDAWLDGKFFLYNNNYGTNAEQILSDMEILERAGVKVFILDNMMAMDIDLFEGDKNSKQKELILRIKDFAKTKMVHIILVAHPRKAVAFLRKTDISGTGDIINAVDNCFIMHRTNEDFLHAVKDFYNSAVSSQLGVFGNVLCVEKNRMFGVVDYFCGMYFEVESRRFKNTIDEDIHYGWEDVGGQGEMFQDTSEPFEKGDNDDYEDPF